MTFLLDSLLQAPEVAKLVDPTPHEVKAAQEEAAPAHLKGRVAKGEALPEVGVVSWVTVGKRSHEKEEGEQERTDVVRFCLEDLSTELFKELQMGLRPTVPEEIEESWLSGKAV